MDLIGNGFRNFELDQETDSGDIIAKIDARIVVEALRKHQFTVVFEDNPFEAGTDRLVLTTVVDDDGRPGRLEAKGKIPMPKETYVRLDTWNLSWR